MADGFTPRIGLPGLYEAKRYAELGRQKFHRWIDGEYERHNRNPDEAEAAGEGLRRELQARLRPPVGATDADRLT